jgi:ABC-type bacteriocin/lantibiotic exporter with double-glycine peptidase domain
VPDATKLRGRAKLSLGLSLVFAVVAFTYLTLTQSLFHGTGIAIVVILAGVWEFYRKRSDAIAAERFEAEAEEQRRKREGRRGR